MKYLIFILFSFQALAIEVTPVKKGDVINQDGYFVSKPEMAKIIKRDEERDNFQKQVLTLEQLNVTNKERHTIMKEFNDDLRYQVRKERVKTAWSGISGFILGTLATSVAVYTASRIVRD